MTLVGLSSLYIFLRGEPFENVIKEIQSEKEDRLNPDIWEIVDEGHHSITHKSVKLIADLSSQGYKFTFHSPFGGINIADLDKEKRFGSLARLKKSLESAAESEAKAVVLHPGLKMKNKNQTIAERLNEESILYLYEYCKSLGIEFTLENMNPNTQYFMTKPSDFEELFEKNKVRLKITFDIGHANIGSEVSAFISRLSDTFAIVHSHDNRGDMDEHLGIGDGSVDWKGVTSQLIKSGFKGIYIVESVMKPFDSVAKLKEMLWSF